MESTDHVLMERWRQGDARAFEELVRRWEGRVARFLAGYGVRRDLLGDLTQEVFVRVLRAGPRYEPRSSFQAWLFQIAVNLARDATRRRQPAPWPEEEPATPREPSATVEEAEATRLVEQALAQLPEPLRLVLVLRHYEDMSFPDMSRLLGAPASTLKSRFAAALGRLRVLLESLRPDLEETER